MGFQRLICLCLDRQPTDDLINGTMKAWLDAWTVGKVWDRDLDTPRFRAAFVKFSTLPNVAWPVPGDILLLLPPREEFKALPVVASDPERAQRIMDEIAQNLAH